MRHYLWIFVMLCGCGEPILKNAPKPDPGAVAGAAAAAAAAATLADPQGAGRRQEEATRSEPDNRGVEVKETAPADAIDRLDHPRDAGTDPPAQAQPPASAAPPAVAPPAAIPLPPAPPRSSSP